MLEQMAFDNGLSTQLIKTKPVISEYDFEPSSSPQQVGCAKRSLLLCLNLFNIIMKITLIRNLLIRLHLHKLYMYQVHSLVKHWLLVVR